MSGGVASTSGIGSVTPSRSVAITGQVITCGQGEFEDQRGQAFYAEQGSLSPVITPNPALASNLITSAQGTVTPSQTTGDVTVHIGGSEQINSAAGSVIPSAFPTSQVSTSAAGLVVVSAETALTGSAITSSTGTVVPGLQDDDTYITSASGTAAPVISKALTGQAITGGHGFVSASAADKTVNLSGAGVVITSATGTAVPVLSFPLSGQFISSGQSNMGAPGYADLSGSQVTVDQGFFGRSYPLSGQEITTAQGTIIGVPGLVALVGEGVSVQQGTLTPSGTQWIPEGQPTTTWTPPASPNSSWTRKDGPSTSWNRKT
jgi:hypothetical protein